MPRQGRIDAPGAYHHIICRGLERKCIFRDDADRNSFVLRLGNILQRTSTLCFAWTLIPNHFHLLLQTGASPMATVMERLLTGYAVYFNHRHNRHGHLFENRYKSILCQANPYFLELVRYIHLNPLRAGLVMSLEELRTFPFSGHARLLGVGGEVWQPTREVLLLFDENLANAQTKYQQYVAEGVALGKRPELAGGGLLRSSGGWQKIQLARLYGEHLKSDERILGESDFVAEVLSAAEEKEERVNIFRQKGLGFEWLVNTVSKLLQMDSNEICTGGKNSTMVQARSLLCYWAIQELGLTATAVAEKLNITQSGASKAAQRGEHLAREKGWILSSDS